nr:Queuosine biosynthesis protein [uncultured bacterium]
MIDPKIYDYELPAEQVAQTPASPRDSSRLFIYDTALDLIQFDTFNNLAKYLPKESLLVLNKTKVIPSRITLYKENKGRVKCLFLVNELKNKVVNAMLDRKVEIGQSLQFDDNFRFKVIGQDEHVFTLAFDFPKEKFINLLERKGSMPIPPYLKHTELKESELRRKYQTIFAKDNGSAAAPTASLHFTQRVFNKLEEKGIQKTFVKLHVGAGTFAPLLEKNLVEGKLHTEWFEVTQKTADSINKAKTQGSKIVAVGTTVARTLETASDGKEMKGRSGETDIFIYPPYTFKTVDILLTNFHVPKSSLMMLVDALLQNKKAKRNIIELYSTAIKERFRFFSFGDAMLIL